MTKMRPFPYYNVVFSNFLTLELAAHVQVSDITGDEFISSSPVSSAHNIWSFISFPNKYNMGMSLLIIVNHKVISIYGYYI